MAKRRCAFEGSRFVSTTFVDDSGYLVHMKSDRKTPVDPPHEAIEGRLLKLDPAAGNAGSDGPPKVEPAHDHPIQRPMRAKRR